MGLTYSFPGVFIFLYCSERIMFVKNLAPKLVIKEQNFFK